MTMLTNLSTLDIVIIITIPSALLIGLLLFFLAGVYRVPKNHAIVIEKMKEFHCIFDKGTHFKMPIVYQKVGTYCIVPQIRRYTANNGNKLEITYQIVDVKKYHYNYIKLEDLMARTEKENSEINLTVLTDKFVAYGLKFIGIKKALD